MFLAQMNYEKYSSKVFSNERIARKLNEKGIDVEIIAEPSGLPLEEIMRL